MKVISLFNKKCGVGKTTIAYTLAKHLQADFLELKHKYGDRKYFDEDGFQKEFESDKKVYDININFDTEENIEHIKETLKKSTYVLIPTSIDLKEVYETIESIKVVREVNENAKIIIIFNRLDTENKASELQYTEYATELINKELENRSNMKYIYIRENRLWFLDFFNDKFYLDFFKKDLFQYVTQYDSNFKQVLDYRDYFTNNRILETLYQHAYYYREIFMRKVNNERYSYKSKTIKDGKIKLTKDEIQVKRKNYIDDYKKALKKLKDKPSLIDKKRGQKRDIDKLYYILQEFERRKCDLISYDYELFELVKKSRIYQELINNKKTSDIEYDALHDTEFPKRISEIKKFIQQMNINIRSVKQHVAFQRDNHESFDLSTNIHDELHNLLEEDDLDINKLDYIDLREKLIYAFVQSMFNLLKSTNNRKILRDMRNLLISINEYKL